MSAFGSGGTRRYLRGMAVGWDAVSAVLRRPALWPTAVVQVLRLAPTGWWRRRPFLPLPDSEYLRFRLQTQYGDSDHEPEPDDVVRWLEWSKRFGKAVG